MLGRLKPALTVTALLAVLLGSQSCQQALASDEGGASSEAGFERVAREVPAFGGVYVDEAAGKLFIWLTDNGRSVGLARKHLIEEFGEKTISQPSTIALQAQYRFLELKNWHDQLSLQALTLPGVVFTDVDDMTNRIRIGVENVRDHGPAVEEKLAELGIPREAAIISQSEPVRPLSTGRSPSERLPDKPVLRWIWVQTLVLAIALAALIYITFRVTRTVARKQRLRRSEP